MKTQFWPELKLFFLSTKLFAKFSEYEIKIISRSKIKKIRDVKAELFFYDKRFVRDVTIQTMIGIPFFVIYIDNYKAWEISDWLKWFNEYLKRYSLKKLCKQFMLDLIVDIHSTGIIHSNKDQKYLADNIAWIAKKQNVEIL